MFPVIASSSKTGGSGSAWSPTTPTGTADGDLLLAFCHSDESASGKATWTPPSGAWTDINGDSVKGGTTVGSSGQLFRKSASSEGANTGNFTRTGGSGNSGVIVVRVTGADETTPINVYGVATNAEDEAESPSVAATVANCVVIRFSTWNEGKTLTSVPSGTTLIEHNDLSSNDGAAVYSEQASSGATGTAVFNLSSTTETANFTVVIAPGEGGGEPDTEDPTDPTGLTVEAFTDNTISISWTASTDNVAVVAYDIDVDGTPIRAEAGLETVVGGLSPSTEYEVGVTARDLAGNTSNRVFTTQTTAAAPSGVPANPGELLWIGSSLGKNHFNVGVGKALEHVDYTEEDIETGYSEDPYFKLTPEKDAVHFEVNVDAETTSAGTEYPRVELRELEDDGTTLAEWSAASGTHIMFGKSRPTHLAEIKPWVCFAQIHDAEDDILRLQVEGTNLSDLKVVARLFDESTVLQESYTLGDEIDWYMEISDTVLKVKLNGTTLLTGTISSTGNYFKAGCYAQSNTTTEGGDATEYFSVELRDLVVWHTSETYPSLRTYTGGNVFKVRVSGSFVTSTTKIKQSGEFS